MADTIAFLVSPFGIAFGIALAFALAYLVVFAISAIGLAIDTLRRRP